MTQKDRAFIRTVYTFTKRYGLRDLPWRNTRDPYRIVVSEIMLQQTQVHRVIPKYREFLRNFPTVQILAKASLADVLGVWQGLGYNRRAKYVHECAQAVVSLYRGRFPTEYRELLSLPGIGRYTAGAVLAFAYNKAFPIIETNIRTVYLHHYMPNATDVSDQVLMLYIERTLDVKNVRTWYAALMDYGSYLKRSEGNLNIHSRHHIRQSRFQGSDRQLRGILIRCMTKKPHTLKMLQYETSHFEYERMAMQLQKLIKESLVTKIGTQYQLSK